MASGPPTCCWRPACTRSPGSARSGLSDLGGADPAAKEATERHGDMSILVNNAGIAGELGWYGLQLAVNNAGIAVRRACSTKPVHGTGATSWASTSTVWHKRIDDRNRGAEAGGGSIVNIASVEAQARNTDRRTRGTVCDPQVRAPALRLVYGFVSQSPPASRATRAHSPTCRDPHRGHFHGPATIPLDVLACGSLRPG